MKLTALAFASLAATVLAAPRSAQVCFGPDLLTGPCCQPTVANLPALNDIVLPGTGLCWTDCTLANQVDTRVEIPTPTQVTCDQYKASVSVRNGAGLLVMTGTATMDYTRTWGEVDPVTGEDIQVWRFVTKVDFELVPGVPPTCWVPTSLTAGIPTAFFYGYVDYALRCSGTWENSLVLFNNCDKYIHAPGFSDFPGVFDPSSTRAIVAPHTPANPFAPAFVLPSSGALLDEAIREAAAPGATCTSEEPVQGMSQVLGQACLCPLAPQPPQNFARRMTAQGACGGSFATIDFFPSLPWLHLIGTSIGTWTTPFSYPGEEQAMVDEGFFYYVEGCTSAAPDRLSFFYGATTRSGYPITTPNSTGTGSLGSTFTDLASNYDAPLFGPYPLPLNGSVRPTDHLIYVNTP